MESDRFSIVFRKLAEAQNGEQDRVIDPYPVTTEELEDIDQLRRLVEETTQPDLRLFTTS
jgi:hypothetical protein